MPRSIGSRELVRHLALASQRILTTSRVFFVSFAFRTLPCSPAKSTVSATPPSHLEGAVVVLEEQLPAGEGPERD
eukprot:15786176-Heterocapsa_arctica.AAC.1